MNKTFMRQAIQLAMDNIKNGGGPFGAVFIQRESGTVNSAREDKRQ